ncbi:uncharacterized protein LOC143869857 [Tasmannia lanceolata]|uniref:uncharacterized protein LOC143869857 n=1 Tax=Tasmannia lanceolata TaxID=3420 RepID=UPI004064324E
MGLPNNMNVRKYGLSFLFIVTLFSFFFLVVESAILENETDRLALLAFKNQIIDDPKGVLTSWNHTLHFCQWQGVTCSRYHHQRVTILNLANQGLLGPTSPCIGNLSFLTEINLANNKFYGQLSADMSHLFRLRSLNLSFNSYQGEIPLNLTANCPNLEYMDLHSNELVGRVPDKFHSPSNLVLLKLSKNNLTGTIPPSLGNLSSLADLFLQWNSLEGSIPYELGRLVNVKNLSISANKLSGMIPHSLYNISSIVRFNVAGNQLYGSLPPNLGLTLPNLEVLYVGLNRFTGPIPVSLANASRLTRIDFSYNSFSESLPMNLGSLQGLEYLNFEVNQLGSKVKSNDLIFLTCLTKCSNLQKLSLYNNYFSGVLPNSIGNLSTQLTFLALGGNQIFGSIPLGIENLIALTGLGMEKNSLTGTIPFGIGKLNKLMLLALDQNNFFGKIPLSLGNITRLSGLYLYGNNLQGSLPSSLGNYGYLKELRLEKNNLTGTIPIQIFKLSSLSKVLLLSHNSFTGYLASEVGNLNQLGALDISYNSLSGEIPTTLGECQSLENLYLNHNFLQGTIPSSLSTLKGIRELDLSQNNFSGKIPEYLEKFLFLEYLNLSFNDLEGEVPKEGIFKNESGFSIEGNKKLCGGILELQLPACSVQVYKKHRGSHTLRAIISIMSLIVCLILFSCFFAIFNWIRKSRKKSLAMVSSEHCFSLGDCCLKVSYAELLRATNGFSLDNLIGVGSYGSVYKGILSHNKTKIAVKVLNLQQHGAFESFNAECKALRNIRHRNLIKIITTCSSTDFQGNDFKALVFEHMPNGSLEKWLHPNEDGEHPLRNLTLIQRLNIAIDVASALDYLHHHGQIPIVHRDLKPSNILLDDDMNAHVGNFGLAMFALDKNQTCSMGIKGSIGYVAPEYGMGGKASTRGDVYGYGILLLEMFTGKTPTDEIFTNGLSLYQFAKKALLDQVMEIAYPQLLLEEFEVISKNNDEKIHSNVRSKRYDFLFSIFRIGVSCCAESPRARMEMQDVVMELHAIKELYLGIGFFRDRQNREATLPKDSSYLNNY